MSDVECSFTGSFRAVARGFFCGDCPAEIQTTCVIWVKKQNNKLARPYMGYIKKGKISYFSPLILSARMLLG